MCHFVYYTRKIVKYTINTQNIGEIGEIVNSFTLKRYMESPKMVGLPQNMSKSIIQQPVDPKKCTVPETSASGHVKKKIKKRKMAKLLIYKPNTQNYGKMRSKYVKMVPKKGKYTKNGANARF